MSRLRGFVPALVVTALALLATVIASIAVHREVTVLEKRQFEMDAEGVSSAIARSMRSYELALSASAALFQTVGDVSDIQWQEFVSGLRLAEFYPGFQGLGYAQVTRSAEVAALEQRRRNAGDHGFKVSPKDEREIYVPIVLLEPRDWRNQRALGFDMFSEPVRRAAMERARDTGIASITAKVVLVQEAGADVQPGTLMYIPVYSGGAPLRSVEDRRQRLLGYAYMAMRMDDLIRAVLQRHMPAALDLFDITLHDGKALDDAAQLFHNHPAHHADAPGDLRFKSELDVAGRTWTVSVQAVQALIDTTDNARPWIVLGAGFIISGLIGAIAAFQSVARSHLSSSRHLRSYPSQIKS